MVGDHDEHGPAHPRVHPSGSAAGKHRLASVGEPVRGMASSSPLQTESVLTRSLGDADFCEIPVEQVVIIGCETWSAFLGGGAGCAPARMSGGGALGKEELVSAEILKEHSMG